MFLNIPLVPTIIIPNLSSKSIESNDINKFSFTKSPKNVAIYLYYSFWSLALVLLHKYTYKYFNLLLSCLIVVVVFSVCAYVYPKYIKINYVKGPPTIIDNIYLKFFMDFTAHWLPFLFIAYKYGGYYLKTPYNASTGLTILIIAIYMTLAKPNDVYDMNTYHMFVATFVAITIYFVASRFVRNS